MSSRLARSAGWTCATPPGLLDLRGQVLELLARARDEQHLAAGLADLERGLEPDPARGARDQDLLPADRARQRALAEEIRVELALPVVPDLRRVARQRGHGDPGAVQHPLGIAGVELALEVAQLHRGGRHPQVAQDLLADPADGRERHDPRAHGLRNRVRHVLIDAHDELGGMRGLRELVERLADAHRLRVDEMERVRRQLVVAEVGDVIHRLCNEIDRDDVGLAALRAGQREPLRQRVTQLLEQLEVVVGAVDLVHLAGLRVADDEPGPVDDRLRLDALAHEPLGLVLGPVIVVWQPLPLVEHVLLEHAAVLAGDGDRADVVKAPDLVPVRELDHVLRALDVRPLRGFLVGLDVVDRGEMEEMVDRLVERRDPEPGLREIARDRTDPALGCAEPLHERVELAPRAVADEDVDRPLALEQLGHEIPSDEARGAGDEVIQGLSTPPVASRIAILFSLATMDDRKAS